MNKEINPEIPSFDTLLNIAENDPELLEKIRNQLAIRSINNAPEPLRRRLRGLQFQINSTCHLAKTPLAACIRISEMMHNSMEELRLSLSRPSLALQPKVTLPVHVKAKVLPFSR
jgi:hypothetical protein